MRHKVDLEFASKEQADAFVKASVEVRMKDTYVNRANLAVIMRKCLAVSRSYGKAEFKVSDFGRPNRTKEAKFR